MALQITVHKVADVKTPSYAHDGDAGADLHSAEDCELRPMERKLVSTGLKIAIPEGYAGLIWDKSGIASKYSVHNIAGVIDSGYRGELKIVMINLGKESFKITKGMKIAQLLIHPVPKVEFIESESLGGTKRGEGGFGSTGTH